MSDIMEFMDGVDWCGAVCLAAVIGSTIIGWAQARFGKKDSEW